MTESTFRRLLWSYIALGTAAIVASLFPTYSAQLAAAYANERADILSAAPALQAYFVAISLGASIAALVGLFFFRRWARSLALYGSLINFLIFPFACVEISQGLQLALTVAADYVWGAILALSYFSAVAAKFES